MNNLTHNDLKKIWDGENNLTDKPIFIDFYGDWCNPCKIFKQVLDEVIPEYKDRIFQVRAIPHFVMISKSGGISPGGGALNKETLKYFLEGLLSK